MKLLILISLFLLINLRSLAQVGGIYPDQFSSYFLNKSLLNPAYIHPDGNSEAIAQSKLRSGFYKDISTIAASAQKVFNTENNQWHSARLLFQNEKEGPYISTPRFYGNYAIRIGLGEKSDLSGGISLGLVNPNIRTPTKSVSTTLLDGSIGLLLRYSRVSAGFSSQQIFNNSSEGIRSIKLRRFYNSTIGATIVEGPFIKLNTYVLWIAYSDLPSRFNGIVSILYNDWLEAGAGYQTRQGALFFASFTADRTGMHPLKISLLYNSVLFNTSNLLQEGVEISISYLY